MADWGSKMFRPQDLLTPGIVVVALSAIFVAERITDRTQPPGPVQIDYWEKWTGNEYEGMKSIVDDFNNSQNRIHVNILSISDVGNKTLLAVSAGVPPDVAGLWGPNVPQYADDNAVEKLDDYCREAGIQASDYIPAYWEISTYKNHIYALPSTPASTALHYNTDLFKKAGLDPANPPKTFEELDAMGDKMTTKKNGSIDVAGFLPAEPGWWNFAWGSFYGGKLWNGKDKITANSPENVRGFEWVQSYSKKYGPASLQTFKSGFGNFSSPQNAFMSQKVAMEIQGVWMHNYTSMYAPELQWAAAPFPHPADRPDLANTSFVDMDVLVIPRGAKHAKEGFEFIRFVQTQKEMEKLCLAHQKNSPLSKISDEFWKNHKNPYIRLFDQLARSKNAVFTPRVGIWPEYNSEMNNAFDQISLNAKTPKEALDAVVARMQPKLDQYLRRQAERGKAGLP